MDSAVQAVAGMRELLKSVSRSFFLTIRWLPAPMRHGVALGYLLGRAADSVADTSTAAPARRLAVLKAMAKAVAGEASAEEESGLLQTLAGEMAEAQGKPSERTLLGRYGVCLEALRNTEAEQAALLRQVLATIHEGQVWDLSYFTPERDCVEGDADTRLYIYRVAGCVGEFWTRLGYATMGGAFSDPAPERRRLMEKAGVRYGFGLQLVNILTDREEDAAVGRHYLASDPEKWLTRAERYLCDGLDYCSRLRSYRLRFASMLPALIGLKTVALLRRHPHDTAVKVSRRSVYAAMLQAAWLSLFPR